MGEVVAGGGEALQVLDRLAAGVVVRGAQGRRRRPPRAAAPRGRRRCAAPSGCGRRRRTARAPRWPGRSRGRCRRRTSSPRACSGWTRRQSSRSLIRSGATPVSSTSSSSVIREPLPASTVAARRSAAPAALLAGARGELLADHPQGQELVALHAQDRPQALDVGLAVEAVAAGRAPRREQLLVLEVADLRDRDVLELAAEDLGDRPDGERLAVRGRTVGRRRRRCVLRSKGVGEASMVTSPGS